MDQTSGPRDQLRVAGPHQATVWAFLSPPTRELSGGPSACQAGQSGSSSLFILRPPLLLNHIWVFQPLLLFYHPGFFITMFCLMAFDFSQKRHCATGSKSPDELWKGCCCSRRASSTTAEIPSPHPWSSGDVPVWLHPFCLRLVHSMPFVPLKHLLLPAGTCDESLLFGAYESTWKEETLRPEGSHQGAGELASLPLLGCNWRGSGLKAPHPQLCFHLWKHFKDHGQHNNNIKLCNCFDFNHGILLVNNCRCFYNACSCAQKLQRSTNDPPFLSPPRSAYTAAECTFQSQGLVVARP